MLIRAVRIARQLPLVRHAQYLNLWAINENLEPVAVLLSGNVFFIFFSNWASWLQLLTPAKLPGNLAPFEPKKSSRLHQCFAANYTSPLANKTTTSSYTLIIIIIMAGLWRILDVLLLRSRKRILNCKYAPKASGLAPRTEPPSGVANISGPREKVMAEAKIKHPSAPWSPFRKIKSAFVMGEEHCRVIMLLLEL